jgi:hypothetical protein
MSRSRSPRSTSAEPKSVLVFRTRSQVSRMRKDRVTQAEVDNYWSSMTLTDRTASMNHSPSAFTKAISSSCASTDLAF